MAPLTLSVSVLIADADPFICRVFEAKLTKEHSFRTVSVAVGPEAVQAAVQQPFDIILWDSRLRDTPGLLARMRALCPAAGILLLTTDDRPTLDSDIARLDIADILVKPLNLDTLVERVEAALATKHLTIPGTHLDLTRIGQSVEIVSPEGVCRTRVLQNSQDTFSVIGAPRVAVPSDFGVGLRVHAHFACNDAVYSFSTRIAERLNRPLESWVIQKPRIIRREQRRKHPRFSIGVPISLERPATSQALEDELTISMRPAPAPIEGHTENLGMGGCMAITTDRLEPGAPVRFVLNRVGGRPISGTGVVLRVMECGPESRRYGGGSYRLAIQFLWLAPAGRRDLRELLDVDA